MPALGSSVKRNGLTTAQRKSLERVWAQLVCLMQRDHVSEVDMPMNIKNLLGNHGIGILVNRFRFVIRSSSSPSKADPNQANSSLQK